MYNLEIYSRKDCNYCHMAKRLLGNKGIVFRELDITHDPVLAEEMQQRSNRRTVPQVFLDNELIGGFEELRDALRDGVLKQLLQQTA